ncbi:hypothetical protein O987_22975 [Comamonas testosteroni TK102]|uniref:Uncharacterized protein n=1 Tax=Comamonas testosteroni TK102 TaxID=1392005 RepID=A0A076PVD9_COMTE|nr:hypothetical protein O987_22975 [Comamonas testosteroni TK102]
MKPGASKLLAAPAMPRSWAPKNQTPRIGAAGRRALRQCIQNHQ